MAKKRSKEEEERIAAEKLALPPRERLSRGMSHPLRYQLLTHLNDREWSPSELADHLAEGLSQVSYHIQVLLEYGLIELTRTEPVRGSTEHFYRATMRTIIDLDMAKEIPRTRPLNTVLPVMADSLPQADATVRLADVPKGQSYMLTAQAVGDLAEHPDVAAAFEGGADTVLLVGEDAEATATPEEVHRVRTLECVREGHDFEIVSSFERRVEMVVCSRCGASVDQRHGARALSLLARSEGLRDEAEVVHSKSPLCTATYRTPLPHKEILAPLRSIGSFMANH